MSASKEMDPKNFDIEILKKNLSQWIIDDQMYYERDGVMSVHIDALHGETWRSNEYINFVNKGWNVFRKSIELFDHLIGTFNQLNRKADFLYLVIDLWVDNDLGDLVFSMDDNYDEKRILNEIGNAPAEFHLAKKFVSRITKNHKYLSLPIDIDLPSKYKESIKVNMIQFSIDDTYSCFGRYLLLEYWPTED